MLEVKGSVEFHTSQSYTFLVNNMLINLLYLLYSPNAILTILRECVGGLSLLLLSNAVPLVQLLRFFGSLNFTCKSLSSSISNLFLYFPYVMSICHYIMNIG